jgi:hypothetical protein
MMNAALERMEDLKTSLAVMMEALTLPMLTMFMLMGARSALKFTTQATSLS